MNSLPAYPVQLIHFLFYFLQIRAENPKKSKDYDNAAAYCRKEPVAVELCNFLIQSAVRHNYNQKPVRICQLCAVKMPPSSMSGNYGGIVLGLRLGGLTVRYVGLRTIYNLRVELIKIIFPDRISVLYGIGAVWPYDMRVDGSIGSLG